jgi:hypothetical protein
MTPAQCSAVLVTRGDVDLRPVLDSLAAFSEVLVWDNSRRTNFKVLGRYRAALEARNAVVYTQDDDCVVEAAEVVAAYEGGKVVCNMPAQKRDEYKALGCAGIALVGWGACFDRELVHRMEPYLQRYGLGELFLRECDRVFTGLNELKLIDAPFQHLPHAFDGRMANEARHLADLRTINERIKSLRH